MKKVISFNLGKTNFIGIEFTDKRGRIALVNPCKRVKEKMNDLLNKSNNTNV